MFYDPVKQYHLQHKHIVHIAEKIGGDIPLGGVILLPMILGGDIYQMHTKKRDPYLKKEDRAWFQVDQIYHMQRTEAWFQGEHD